MLICIDCGHKFDESELATWNEDRGEFWGSRCYETFSGCPNCYSTEVMDYDEYLREEREAAEDEEGEEE